MSRYEPFPCVDPDEAEAAHALVRLRGVLMLVEQIAGSTDPAARPSPIDQQLLNDGAAIALDYANASSIARRRFDALAGEAAAFGAAGLNALMRQKQRTGRDQAAARQLAEEMRQSIDAMARIIAAPVPRA